MRSDMVVQLASTIPSAPSRLWKTTPPSRLTAEKSSSHLFCACSCVADELECTYASVVPLSAITSTYTQYSASTPVRIAG